MGKMKHKRNLGVPKPSYAERLRQKEEEALQRKKGWTHNVYVYTLQETLDIAGIALYKDLDFDPEQLKKFMQAFHDVFAEVMENHRVEERFEENDHWYSLDKFEEAMKAAWGPYYQTRDKRYAYDYAIEAPDKPVIDQ